jgi:glucose/arabinose dehydrogenase
MGLRLKFFFFRRRNSFLLAGLFICSLIAALSCLGCSGAAESNPTTPPPPPPTPTLELLQVATGFTNPLEIQQPLDSSGRLFVVQQGGKIMIVNSSGKVLPTPFLDLTSQLISGGEEGLVGLAFHPNFVQNGCFYVNYTTTRLTGNVQTVISEFKASPSSANVADTSESILFTVNQPFDNHKGGGLAFGPDGDLYIGLGDGGSEGDPLGNGQNTSTALGKMLRISVTCNGTFSVPLDNPFANQPNPTNMIYAYGLRNPFRFSFDRQGGGFYVVDVGQDMWEEVDLVTKGNNDGWSIMEGDSCYNPPTGCNMTGLTLPIFVYPHTNGNAAVIGGYVYRGSEISQLVGQYVFGDYISGRIWTLAQTSPGVWTQTQILSTGGSQLTSFGQDQNGELYITNYMAGTIYRIHLTGTP